MTHGLCCIGPVVRLSPTLLVVSDATFLPTIYHRYVDKSQHYITGSFGKIESVFNMQKHKQHAHHRKIVAGPVCSLFRAVTVGADLPKYSFTNIKRMEPLIDARIQCWISKLSDEFAKTGKKFDFAPWAV